MSFSVPNDSSAQAYFQYISVTCPPAYRVWIAASEVEFCEAVEEALDRNVKRIEEGARQYRGLPELGLSKLLSQLLHASGIPAFSEGYNNGHVDITVVHPAEKFDKILGECKIYRDYDWHCKGCHQVLNRYSSGRAKRAFCLEFFKVQEMYAKLQAIRKKLNADFPNEQQGVAANHKRIKGGFISRHAHASGATVEVLHFGCSLYVSDK